MTVLEIELPDDAARQLIHEASSFEFPDRESYVRWLLEHRAVVLSGDDEARAWREEMEERLRTLEAQVDRRETERAEQGPVKQTLDRRFADVHSADDEDVKRAVASIDGTVGDELDL